jgi:hypothetical protein
MMLVLNLSRSYRGLVFRVTVPCERQGHILEVIERKRTVLQRVDSLSEAARGMEAEARSNKRPSYSMFSLVPVLPMYISLWPSFGIIFASLITLDDGDTASTALRTLRDKRGYQCPSSFKPQ